MTIPQRSKATIPGAAYQILGDGEPIVLLHGVGLQSDAWYPQIDFLCNTHCVVAIDLPGHGDSPALQQSASLQDYVEWLRGTLTILGLAKVNIAGHSMGALIAAGYTITYPASVLRVALLNGVFCRSPEARRAVERRAREVLSGEFNLHAPLDRWFASSETDRSVRKLVKTWLDQVNKPAYACAYSAFAMGDNCYSEQWNTIACPLLALTADGDQNSTPAMAKEMASLARNGRVVVIEGHRHMMNLTAPGEVNYALSKWLLQSA